MGETQGMLALWRRAQGRGESVCVATVVHVEGSSYRKPGARMLVTAGGERSGTISGGCLEAEVSRKIRWLTREGPVVEQYQSSFDEDGGGVPWGLGCGGTVWLLLQRDPIEVLEALESAHQKGLASVALHHFSPARTLSVTDASRPAPQSRSLQAAIARSLAEQRSLTLDEDGCETSDTPAYLAEYLQPPPRLTVFGGGDDAQPIVRFADALGWRVAVADGRSHLLRPERFPEAAELRTLAYPADAPPCGVARDGSSEDRSVVASIATGVAPGELAVILTHSFEQDLALLRALLPAGLAYLGILGPRHRTERLLEEVAPALGWSVDACWALLHAPVGLDLGARDPAAIALAIVAELQAVLSGRRIEVHPEASSAPQRRIRARA